MYKLNNFCIVEKNEARILISELVIANEVVK